MNDQKQLTVKCIFFFFVPSILGQLLPSSLINCCQERKKERKNKSNGNWKTIFLNFLSLGFSHSILLPFNHYICRNFIPKWDLFIINESLTDRQSIFETLFRVVSSIVVVVVYIEVSQYNQMGGFLFENEYSCQIRIE